MEQAIKDAKLLLHKINNGDEAFGKATDDVKRVLTNTYIADKQECADLHICPYCKGCKYGEPCDVCMDTGIYDT